MHVILVKTFRNLLSIALLYNYCLSLANAQHYNIDWVNAIGRNSYENISSIALGNDGYIYSVGSFNDTLNFSPNQGSMILSGWNPGFSPSTFIYKTDKEGNAIWVKKLSGKSGSPFTSYGSSIVTDQANNLYIVGIFEDTVDFDPGPNIFNLVGGFTPFLLKLDSDGNFIYAYELANIDYTLIKLELDHKNNDIIIYGSLYGADSVDLDPGPNVVNHPLTPPGLSTSTAFLIKLDSSANYIWGKTFLGVSSYSQLEIKDIALDPQGNILLTGQYSGIIDLDPGIGAFNSPTPVGASDIFITKLDNSGNFIWAKTIGSPHDDWAYSIAADNQGNVYVTGIYFGTTNASASAVDFDPGPDTFNLTPNGNALDMFILKLDSSGSFCWAKSFGGESYGDIGLSIGVSNSGIVYTLASLTITSVSGIDFDPGPGVFNVSSFPPIPGSHHMTLSLLDTAGNFMWGGLLTPPTVLSASPYYLGAIAYDEDKGDFYIGGEYRPYGVYDSGTIDFDPGPNILTVNYGGGVQDIFLLKLSPCIQADTTITNACDSFIFKGETYTQSGLYFHNSSSIPGICDSIFTLQLTLGYNISDTLNISTCDSFHFDKKIYTASGTYFHTFSSNNNCDSIVTLYLDIKGQTPDTSVLQSGNTLTSLAFEASFQWIDCSNNNTPVPGATTQSFIPESSGNYAVIVTGSGGCSDTSGCYITKGSSKVLELYKGNQIKVFPNPAKDRLYITTTLPLQNAEIKVVNILGQKILEHRNVKDKFIAIDTQTLPAGLYTIEIKDGAHKVTIKAVKSN